MGPVDLVEFLLARIAEDEQTARRAAGDSPTTATAPLRVATEPGRGEVVAPVARVLAECEAKRIVVEQYRAVARVVDSYGGLEQLAIMFVVDALEGALTALALPYAYHPDYREEWRP
ncbi:DUF6221 family protein [Geodermatophilus ruber]|uniref:Uncharacterized protein n=1 Tax=Geodermatophilus ruber TaxID=504800 RepID=A0A1I4IJS5_9ACTN|nr:DUF6221 family protein [Geodermatophilus ruber]SFL54659.1 hypothetical protein SAMN04488085_11325 [Geodermatophilus ruber]